MTINQPINILHIIQNLSLGGAARALIATAKYSSTLGDFNHTVLSLQPAQRAAVTLAEASGRVIDAPDKATIMQQIQLADIVHFHFWNTPYIYNFLKSDFPPMRLMIWLHIAGDHAPQVITKKLVEFADFILSCSPHTHSNQILKRLPAEVRTRKTAMVYGATDFARLANHKKIPHESFNVGYIGSVNFVKMYPRYIEMNATINIPKLKFIVCGSGNTDQLSQKAKQLNAADRFDFRGHVEDIRSVTALFDIYGYPLCQDTYAAAELNIQDAMFAQIPCVVFPHGGIKRLVINNFTGLVVDSELEYKEAIEYLYHNSQERERLGRNAKEYAGQIFGAENAAKALNPIYLRLMNEPKRLRSWNTSTENDGYQSATVLLKEEESSHLLGAQAFIESLGDSAQQFATCMGASNIDQLYAADRDIAASTPLLASENSGGIHHYLNYYQEDCYLRFWYGLILQNQNQHATALQEFKTAINRGFAHWRINWHMAQSAKQIGDLELAQVLLNKINHESNEVVASH